MTAYQSICRAWLGRQPFAVSPLASAGMSGSRVFLVSSSDALGNAAWVAAQPDQFVLKNFTRETSTAHAQWVHGLMIHLRSHGVWQVPEVIRTNAAETIVIDPSGTRWELVRFMPGNPLRQPSLTQATAALETLATLHLAAARLAPGPRMGLSPNEAQRSNQAVQLLHNPWQQRRDAIWHKQQRMGPRHGKTPGADRWPLIERMDAAIAMFAAFDGRQALEQMIKREPCPVPLTPVLRDRWSDHMLFATSPSPTHSPSAIIDFHAAGIDTPATDLARLLGSWQSPSGDMQVPLVVAWQAAIAAYHTVRPLCREERSLISTLYCTGVVIGLDNWFRWTLQEDRTFPNSHAVLERIDCLLERLAGVLVALQSDP